MGRWEAQKLWTVDSPTAIVVHVKPNFETFYLNWFGCISIEWLVKGPSAYVIYVK